MLNLATVDKPGLVSYMPELVLYYYKWDCPIKTLMILCKVYSLLHSQVYAISQCSVRVWGKNAKGFILAQVLMQRSRVQRSQSIFSEAQTEQVEIPKHTEDGKKRRK